MTQVLSITEDGQSVPGKLSGWQVFTLTAAAVGGGLLRRSRARERLEEGPNVHVKLSSGHMPSVSG